MRNTVVLVLALLSMGCAHGAEAFRWNVDRTVRAWSGVVEAVEEAEEVLPQKFAVCLKNMTAEGIFLHVEVERNSLLIPHGEIDEISLDKGWGFDREITRRVVIEAIGVNELPIRDHRGAPLTFPLTRDHIDPLTDERCTLLPFYLEKDWRGRVERLAVDRQRHF